MSEKGKCKNPKCNCKDKAKEPASPADYLELFPMEVPFLDILKMREENTLRERLKIFGLEVQALTDSLEAQRLESKKTRLQNARLHEQHSFNPAEDINPAWWARNTWHPQWGLRSFEHPDPDIDDRIKEAVEMVEQTQKAVAESMAEVQGYVKELVDHGLGVIEQSMFSNRHILATELQEKQDEHNRKIKEINDRLNCTLNNIEAPDFDFMPKDTIKPEEGGLTNREKIISLLDKIKKDPNIGMDREPMQPADQWTPEQIEEFKAQRKKDLAQIAVCADIMARVMNDKREIPTPLAGMVSDWGGWKVLVSHIEASGLDIEDIYGHIYSLAERHKKNLESLQHLTPNKVSE